MGNCGSGKNYDKKDRSQLYEQQNGQGSPEAPQDRKAGGPPPGSNISFNPVKYDHVIANEGNVEKEYKLITPPLGQGAFGEVRKAIHKASGLERAVKIIYKDKSDPVELAKIKDEVRLNF